MTPQAPPRLYTVREVGAILRITTQSVRGLIYSGKLEGRRIGISIRIQEEALTRFIHASLCQTPDRRRGRRRAVGPPDSEQ